MNEPQRDELLIRLDERTEATHRWILEHKQTHLEERTTRTKWSIFYLGSLIALVSRLVFWK